MDKTECKIIRWSKYMGHSYQTFAEPELELLFGETQYCYYYHKAHYNTKNDSAIFSK